MYKTVMLVLLLLTIPSLSAPCFGLDYLDEVNLIDNIIKSFDEEPQNWYIGSSYAVYAKSPRQLKEALSHSYPELEANSIIVFSFNLNRHMGGSYIAFDKPDIGFISEYKDDRFEKFDRAIKIQVYKKLKFEVGSEAEIKIKRKEVIKKDEEIKEVDKTFKPL